MSGTDLLNYFNYAIIAIIALGALGGFLKGTYKSTYHIITSFIIIIIGWLASDKIIDFILTFDLSSYNIAIPIGETVINLTTLEETIAVFLAGFLGVEAETVVTLELYLFAMAVIKFPLKLVFILLLLLLNVTVFKFIFWIVWLFIKPKKHVTKNEKGRKVKEKVKLSLLSRTGGAAVGVVHSLIGLLILIVPISALCSLGTKMSPVFDMVMPNEESSEQVTLTIGEDGKIYKFNGGMDLGIDMSMLAPYVEFMEKYDESLASKIYGAVEIEGKSLDRYIASELESIKYNKNDEVIELKLTDELVHVLNIYTKLADDGVLKGDIANNILDIKQETINYIFDEIAELKILNIAVPIGAEYLQISGMLDNMAGENISSEDLKVVLTNITSHNLAEELKSLGYGLGEIFGAIQAVENPPLNEEGSVDYFALAMQLDDEKVQAALNHIGEMKVLDEVSDFMLSYLVNSGTLDSLLMIKPTISKSEDGYFMLGDVKTNIPYDEENAELSIIDGYWAINGIVTTVEVPENSKIELVTDGVKLTDNIKALGGLYTSIKNLGINSVDDFANIFNNTEKLTDENIDAIAEAIFGLSIISKNSKTAANLISNMLPAEYAGLFEINDITKDDLSSILKLGVILADSGILDGGEINYVDLLLNKSEKLIEALYSSDIIAGNIDSLIRTLLGGAAGDFLAIPPKDELDFGTEAGKQELLSLIDVIGLIIDDTMDFSNLDINVIINKLVNLTDGTDGTEDQIGKILSSRILVDTIILNIDKLAYDEVDNPDGFLVINLEREDWYDKYEGETRVSDGEMRKIIKVISSIFEGEDSIDFNNFDVNLVLKKVGNETFINSLVDSQILTDTIIKFLYDFAYDEVNNPSGILVINLAKDAPEWKDTETEQGELRKIFKVITKLFEGEENIDLNSIDVNKILNKVSDDAFIDALVDSTVLNDTIIKFLYDFAYDEVNNPSGILVINLPKDAPEWKDTETEDGELRKIFKVITKLFEGEENIDLNAIDASKILNKVSDDAFIDALVSSTVLNDTIIKFLYDFAYDEVNNPSGILVINLSKDSSEWKDTETEDGELRKIFKVITKLFEGEENIDLNAIDASKILNKVSDDAFVDALVDSTVLNDTIIKFLYDFAYDEVNNPSGILVINLAKDAPEWKDTETKDGELRKIFKVVTKLFEGEENIDLNAIDASKILNKVSDDAFVDALVDSTVLNDTIIKFLYDFAYDEVNNPSGMLVINLAKDSPEWKDTESTEGELRKVFKVISELFAGEDDVDLNSLDATMILNKVSDDAFVDALVDSQVLTDTIVKYLYDYKYDEVTNPSGMLVINLAKDSPEWKDTESTEGELRKVFKVISELFAGEDDVDLNALDSTMILNKIGDETFVDALVDSQVLTDTIVKYLYDYKYDEVNNPSGMLVINLAKDSPEWKDTETKDGELRKVFKVINQLFGEDDVDLNALDSTMILNKVGNDAFVNALVDSQVLSDTVIKYLYDYKYDEVTKPDGMLVINLDKDSSEWKDTESKEGELRKVFRVIDQLFGVGEDVDLGTIDSNTILNKVKDDAFVNALVDSQVLSDTVIKYLYDYKYDEVNNPTGILVINITKDSPEWKDSESEDGELRKVFKGINQIFADAVDLDSIDANIIVDLTESDIEIILNSDVFEDTFRKQLVDLDGESIVVNPTHISTKQKLTDELVNLKGAMDAILEKDPVTNKIDLNNPNVNADNILSLTGENREKVISSYIISDTIIKQLKGNGTLVVNRGSYDWYGVGGELDNILLSVSLLFTGGSLDSFSVNAILDIENNFGQPDDEIDDLLRSVVLRDTIVTEIIKLDSSGSATENIIVKEHSVYATTWDDNLLTSTPGEIRNLLTSIKILLGEDADLTNPSLSFDTVFNKTESEINDMFISEIISDTVAIQVYNMLETGSVKDYIKVSGDNKEEKLVTIKDDQVNLLIVLKRLNNNHGIKYDAFSLTAFQNAISSDSDADAIAVTMCGSNIIVSSLTPMMSNIMDQALSNEDYALLDFSFPEADWKPSAGDPGELAYLLRNIPSIENITDIVSDPNITNKETLTAPLMRINHSAVLHNLLPKYTESALGAAGSWRSDAVLEDLSTETWDEEIDTLGNIIVAVNSNGVNLGSMNVTGEGAISTATLKNILLAIVPSRIIEIDNIRGIIVTGVNNVFTGSEYTVEDLGKVSWTPEEDWDARTSAWNLEIENLMNAVAGLQDIKSTDITSRTALTIPAYDSYYVERDYYVGVYNARFIGRFLDKAKKSVIVSELVDKIANSVLSVIPGVVIDKNASYEHQFRYNVLKYIKVFEYGSSSEVLTDPEVIASGFNAGVIAEKASQLAITWMSTNFKYE